MLSDLLKVSVMKASVTRLDIAHNLIMDYKPELYYPFLGYCNRYKRIIQPKSLYYENTLRQKLFYNKVAECKSRGESIPIELQRKNILRYELRYLKRLNRKFSVEVTPAVLLSDKFYSGLIEHWAEEYAQIQKIGLVNMNLSKIRSPKDFFKQITASGIQEKGLDSYLNQVDILKQKKVFKNPESYSRLRNDLKSFLSNEDVVDMPELIFELNQKVKMAKAF
jgi:hypothetical protein